MPSRNIYKEYLPESYYHIYNRGINKQPLFRDDQDYRVFLSFLKRYLGGESGKRTSGALYPSFKGRVELLAFCLMPSHFHLLIYQNDAGSMTMLLRSLGVSYSMYFNKKYDRLGPVFQQRYKAARINDDSYLLHISRYIHLNPDSYKAWQWSSLPYYLGNYQADWVKPDRILELFEGEDYSRFVEDYTDRRSELEEIKYQLADY